METFLYKRLPNKNPELNIWYAYPAIESFAMASLGYLSIFKMMDLNPSINVQRIYQDTKNPPCDIKSVDCIIFSFSFEIDILGVIKMLKKYNIPLKSSQRDDTHPLIFAGGPVLTSNPLPFEEFFDFISIGEKACLNEVFDVIRQKNLEKNELLKKVSDIEGIYVPKYKKKQIKLVRDDLSDEIIYTSILSDKSYFSNSIVIEIERGCPKMCAFCNASWLNLPVRFVPYEKIIKTIDFALLHTNKIALLGAYVAGHPRFDDIIDYILEKRKNQEIELSISSLRADLTGVKLVEALVKCGQKTATIALEAGSQKLRNYIRKDLSDEQVLKTIEIAQSGGLKGIKIYTMIGLPNEKEEDIKALVDLAKKMKEQIKNRGGNFEITISTSTLIPKAHTPFEKVEREEKKSLDKKMSYLKKNFHKLGITFRPSSIDWDIIQSILSRFPYSLADVLIEANEKGSNLGAIKQTYRKFYKEGKLPISYEEAAILPFNPQNELPWSFIDTGANKIKKQIQNEIKKEG